ncbi:MAG: hypothetical protein J1G02_01095 [Clostridiales bacterium]|nr:hypothetical protein [Clostridiales bacterium]
MNGKENIINKILSDADAKAAEILSAAESSAQTIIDKAEQAIAGDRQALEQRLQTVAAERQRNRKATAELDAKKYTLERKQQLISRCYELVYDKLVHMSDEERQGLIGSLLEKYAEAGETVYVTQADAKFVTQVWLNGFEKNLTLGKKYIKADGGIVLEGNGYEKDLTLKSVVKYLREQTENKVVELLLGAHDE